MSLSLLAVVSLSAKRARYLGGRRGGRDSTTSQIMADYVAFLSAQVEMGVHVYVTLNKDETHDMLLGFTKSVSLRPIRCAHACYRAHGFSFFHLVLCAGALVQSFNTPTG